MTIFYSITTVRKHTIKFIISLEDDASLAYPGGHPFGYKWY